VGVHGAEHRLGEARELGVDLQLDTGREESETFQQALHVWIGARELVESQPAGDLRILTRELAAGLPDEL
jgi:hypothetical protein